MVRLTGSGVMLLVALALSGCGMNSEVKSDPVFQADETVFTAAAAGDVEAVKYYIQQYSWDPIIADFNGVVPLCYAAQSGNVEVIRLMVEYGGADVNYGDLNQKKPLTYAKESGNQDAIQYLQQMGATE